MQGIAQDGYGRDVYAARSTVGDSTRVHSRAGAHPEVRELRNSGWGARGGLHGVVAFAQESGDVQVGLLEVGDHGIAHAIESDSIR